MFDITPKEQTIKQVRKGLVQPLPNKYPLLNFDSDVFKKSMNLIDEDFVAAWVEKGFFFNTCGNSYDFLSQITQLKEEKSLGNLAIGEKKLIDLFNDNGILHVSPENLENTLVISALKLESTTMSVCFSSEIQPIKMLNKSKNLVIYAKNTHVETPSSNPFFSEITVKNDLRVQLGIGYFKRFESVYLLMEI